jgi:predicted DsbA family dithiol-disulfide isomerase
MNERIKQLAEQAGIAVWGDAVYMYHPGNTLDSTVMTKFAELIVKKCADIATNRYQRLMDGGKAIKEHFGVE